MSQPANAVFDLSIIQKSLLLALRKLSAERNELYVQSAKIIDRAATDLGTISDEDRRLLYSEGLENSPGISHLYDELIALVGLERLVIGKGNFGTEEDPPADPLFTKCSLTSEGADFCERL